MLNSKWVQESKYVEALKIEDDNIINYYVEENPAHKTYNSIKICNLEGCESGEIMDTHNTKEDAKSSCEDDYLLNYNLNGNVNGEHESDHEENGNSTGNENGAIIETAEDDTPEAS